MIRWVKFSQYLHVNGHCLSRNVNTMSPSKPVIQVTPTVSLFDQKVDIKLTGLPKHSEVTVHAMFESPSRRSTTRFVSSGHFMTDRHGEVNLADRPSEGGTYTGIDPMGLFWSMRPSPRDDQHIRANLPNHQYAYPYTLTVYSGHQTLEDIHVSATSKFVAQTTIQRLVKAPGVREIPVSGHSTRVRGALFLPPGVISMYGYAPGLKNHRSAILASHGFACLSLAYFGFEDLPGAGENLDFEYFEESARWLSSHKAVKGPGIGVLGNSFGGTLALLMAWKCPEVSAVATLNATSGLVDILWRDEVLRHRAQVDTASLVQTEEGMMVGDSVAFDLEKETTPVWERTVPHLAFVGCDDLVMKPSYAHQAKELCPDDKRHLIQLVHYPDTGHLMDPSYYPFCRSCYFAPFGGIFMFGGKLKAHAAAQVDAWNRTLEFFNTHLE